MDGFVGALAEMVSESGPAGAVEVVLGAFGLAWAVFVVRRARAGRAVSPVNSVAPLLLSVLFLPFGAALIEHELVSILPRVAPDLYGGVWARVLDRAWHGFPGVVLAATLPGAVTLLSALPAAPGRRPRALVGWAIVMSLAATALGGLFLAVATSDEPMPTILAFAFLPLARAAWAITPEPDSAEGSHARRTLALSFAVTATLTLVAWLAMGQIPAFVNRAALTAVQKAEIVRSDMEDINHLYLLVVMGSLAAAAPLFAPGIRSRTTVAAGFLAVAVLLASGWPHLGRAQVRAFPIELRP